MVCLYFSLNRVSLGASGTLQAQRTQGPTARGFLFSAVVKTTMPETKGKKK